MIIAKNSEVMMAPLSNDGLYNLLIAIGLLLIVIVAAAGVGRRRPSLRWTAYAIAVVGALVFALYFRLLPMLGLQSGLQWNWWGKLVAITACLGFGMLDRGVSRRDVGFCWPVPGSLFPGLVAMVIVCVADWVTSFTLSHGTSNFPSLETVLYQATMPGLHEELFHRAIVTLLLERALGHGGGFRLAGANLSLGALASVIWFGLLHGIGVQNGTLGVSLEAIAMTGAVGFGLQWIFARTRSLAIPVLAHNLTNVGLLLIP